MLRRLFKELQDGLMSRGPGSKGALVGFSLALLLVIFGFWKTLFILILTVVGYILGVRYFSNKEAFRELLNKIFPPGLFR